MYTGHAGSHHAYRDDLGDFSSTKFNFYDIITFPVLEGPSEMYSGNLNVEIVGQLWLTFLDILANHYITIP